MSRILIAEDSLPMRALLEAVFRLEADIVCDVIADNFDALPESYCWEQCDMALVDQYLGPILGSELFGWLAVDHPKVRRLMLTGDTAVTLRQANADLVLYKPVMPDALVSAVRSLLSQ